MEIQEFKEKVNQVAIILKMNILFPSDDDMRWNKYAHLTKGYQEIRISNSDCGDIQFHISGDFPKTEKGQHIHYGQSPSINVSDSKTPEQIARDIEKRLLPIYLPELEKTIGQVDRINIYDQKRKANIQKMADYFGIEFKEDNQEPSIYFYENIEGLGSRIWVQGENKVKFELELTPEMAIKVFDLLKQG